MLSTGTIPVKHFIIINTICKNTNNYNVIDFLFLPG